MYINVIYKIEDQERFGKLEKAVKLMSNLIEGRESGYISDDKVFKRFKYVK